MKKKKRMHMAHIQIILYINHRILIFIFLRSVSTFSMNSESIETCVFHISVIAMYLQFNIGIWFTTWYLENK